MALRTLLVTPRQRWIGANILRDTGRLALLVVQNVAEDAGGDGVFGVLAGAAGELQLVGLWVFFRVEHVGAGQQLGGEVNEGVGYMAYHSEQKRKVICSRCFFGSSSCADGEDMVRLVMRWSKA